MNIKSWLSWFLEVRHRALLSRGERTLMLAIEVRRGRYVFPITGNTREYSEKDKVGRVGRVRTPSQTLTLFKKQNLLFSPPYLWPDQKFDTQFKTCPWINNRFQTCFIICSQVQTDVTCGVKGICEGLLLMVLPNGENVASSKKNSLSWRLECENLTLFETKVAKNRLPTYDQND